MVLVETLSVTDYRANRVATTVIVFRPIIPKTILFTRCAGVE